MLSHRWNISLFGTLRLENDAGVRVTRFPTRKTALLLAYLARHVDRPPVSRERLADLLWPEADPDAARHSLRQAVAALRRQLEPPGTPRGAVLTATGHQFLSLNPEAVTVDVARFERALRRAAAATDESERRAALETALALCAAGDLLDGFYEDWVITERPQFEEAARAARERLARLASPADAPPKPAPASSAPKPAPAAAAAAAVPAPPVRLPAPLTRFFGRREELESVVALLRDSRVRMITLIGPGGSGKTRLAVEAATTAARDLRANRFPGILAFVPLADQTDPARLPDALRAAVAMAASPSGSVPSRSAAAAGADPIEEVAARLNDAPALLVLDNFEQLVPGAGVTFLRTLLSERCPNLTCLVTSRRALGIPGEREIPVPPLPTPPLPGTPARLMEFASVQLFVDRAQAVRPDFQVTERNAAAVLQICQRLEGIPLALELAAARARALAPAQILAQLDARLDGRFALLESRDPNAPDRHRSLYAAIDGSVRVLPPDLRRFFFALATFRGGWTLEAAGAVAGEGIEGDDALDALERLTRAALIVAEDAGDVVRFRMLETLREYALAESDPAERAEAARRHADCFVAFAEARAREMAGPGQADALRALDAERENLRAALAWTAAEGDAPGRLRLTAALAPYWAVRGDLRTARPILAETFDATGDVTEEAAAGAPRLRTRIADALASVCAQTGDFETARAWAERSLALSRALPDDFGIARSLNNLGSMAVDQKRWTEAEAYLTEGLAVAERVEHRPMLAAIRNNLALTLMETGRLPVAADLFRENLTLRRDLGDARGVALTLLNLADVHIREQDGVEACRLYRQSLTHLRELGDLPNTTIALEGLAQALLLSGRPADARRAAALLGAADALRERTGAIRRPEFAAAYPHLEAALRAALGDDGFMRRFAEGGEAPLERVLERETASEAAAAATAAAAVSPITVTASPP